MSNPANFFKAVSLVGFFSHHCAEMGWSPRPAYAPHIVSAVRCALRHWSWEQVTDFCKEFALDYGGRGPQPIRWSRPCTACGGRGPHEYSFGSHVYTTAEDATSVCLHPGCATFSYRDSRCRDHLPTEC